MPCPCHAPPIPFFSKPQHSTAQHSRLSTAVLCCGLEKKGMVGAWHGHGMASVNQTRPHCVTQMGKTHYKPLAARHGRVTAWARHGHGMLCVNRPLIEKNIPGVTVTLFSTHAFHFTHSCNKRGECVAKFSLFMNIISLYGRIQVKISEVN